MSGDTNIVGFACWFVRICFAIRGVDLIYSTTDLACCLFDRRERLGQTPFGSRWSASSWYQICRVSHGNFFSKIHLWNMICCRDYRCRWVWQHTGSVSLNWSRGALRSETLSQCCSASGAAWRTTKFASVWRSDQVLPCYIRFVLPLLIGWSSRAQEKEIEGIRLVWSLPVRGVQDRIKKGKREFRIVVSTFTWVHWWGHPYYTAISTYCWWSYYCRSR
jgi:hypothetical protein